MLYNDPTYIEFLFFSVHRNVESARKHILHERILSGRKKNSAKISDQTLQQK